MSKYGRGYEFVDQTLDAIKAQEELQKSKTQALQSLELLSYKCVIAALQKFWSVNRLLQSNGRVHMPSVARSDYEPLATAYNSLVDILRGK